MGSSKHVEFLAIAGRNLGRFRSRTVAILVPLFIVMAYASAMTFIKDGLLHGALEEAGTLPDITVQRMIAGKPGYIEPGLSAEIAAYPNVSRVVPRVWGYVSMPSPGKNALYTLMGEGALDNASFGPEGKNKALVGKSFAVGAGARPGDKILLKDEAGNESVFEIAGIFSNRSRLYDSNFIITDAQSARKFFGYTAGQSTDLGIYLKEPLYSEQAAKSILVAHRDLRALTKENIADKLKQDYGWRSGVFQLAWLILLLTVMLLAWAQASSITMEMRKEIGILKAVGWRTLDIIELKMIEIGIIGLLGIIGGILFGILYIAQGAPLAKEYFLGMAWEYPQSGVPLRIEWGSLFLIFVLGIFPLSVATVLPAWIMGSIEPDNAIRMSEA